MDQSQVRAAANHPGVSSDHRVQHSALVLPSPKDFRDGSGDLSERRLGRALSLISEHQRIPLIEVLGEFARRVTLEDISKGERVVSGNHISYYELFLVAEQTNVTGNWSMGAATLFRALNISPQEPQRFAIYLGDPAIWHGVKMEHSINEIEDQVGIQPGALLAAVRGRRVGSLEGMEAFTERCNDPEALVAKGERLLLQTARLPLGAAYRITKMGEKALELNPSSTAARWLIVRASSRDNVVPRDPKRSFELLTRIAELNPGDHQAAFEAAEILFNFRTSIWTRSHEGQAERLARSAMASPDKRLQLRATLLVASILDESGRTEAACTELTNAANTTKVKDTPWECLLCLREIAERLARLDPSSKATDWQQLANEALSAHKDITDAALVNWQNASITTPVPPTDSDSTSNN